MAALLAAIALPALSEVVVSDAWVRGTVPQQKTTGAYMQLKSASDARVVEVRSPVAGTAEIHQVLVVDGRMTMRPAGPLELPAGKLVELKPGGFHIMLMELKQPLKEGDSVAISIVFENADRTRGTVDVNAVVRPLTARVPTPP
jgi:copper(I)-binding protein